MSISIAHGTVQNFKPIIIIAQVTHLANPFPPPLATPNSSIGVGLGDAGPSLGTISPREGGIEVVSSRTVNRRSQRCSTTTTTMLFVPTLWATGIQQQKRN